MTKGFIGILLLSMLLFGCGGSDLPKDELSDLVSEAILSENESSYSEAECCGEGHEILGSKISGNQLKVYALTMFGNYGFQNDMFIKVSGSGVIPAVLLFEKTDNQYKLLEIDRKMVRSIRKV